MPFVTLGVQNHDNLIGVSAGDHHTATVAGDLDHQDLSTRGVADHHQDLPGLATAANEILVASGAGVFLVRPASTQSQMEAGTSTVIRGMTALNIKQAIDFQVGDIIQAEEGSGTTVSVTWNTAFGSTPVVAGACVGVSGASATEVFNLITARSTTGATGRPTDVDGQNRDETAMFIAMLTGS